MKKHRRLTKQISDGFLARKALTYWRNMSRRTECILVMELVLLMTFG